MRYPRYFLAPLSFAILLSCSNKFEGRFEYESGSNKNFNYLEFKSNGVVNYNLIGFSPITETYEKSGNVLTVKSGSGQFVVEIVDNNTLNIEGNIYKRK
jgi:hypothetical protein